MSAETGTASVVTACFVVEQHVGHKTYADNLRTALEQFDPLRTTWVPVEYSPASTRLLAPIPGSLRAFASGRNEVRAGTRHDDADVLVFNTQVPAALGGRRVLRKPYVVITDVTPLQYDAMADGYGHSADRMPLVKSWKERVNRRVFRGARTCVAWSRWAADSIVDDYGVQRRSVVVIPPGVDTRRWTPSPRDETDRVRLLFVGGEFDRKGGDLLLEAHRLLPDNVELDIVTKSALTAGPRVRVIDDISPNDDRLVDLVRSADVFVLPSRAETFGIAAVEASACGVPVIASDMAGFRDIVSPGESGLLVEPDVGSLSNALQALVGDASLRRRMGAAARERSVRLFDAETNARRLLDVVVDAAMTGDSS